MKTALYVWLVVSCSILLLDILYSTLTPIDNIGFIIIAVLCTGFIALLNQKEK